MYQRILTCIALLASSWIGASPLTLDTSFGNGTGKASTSLGLQSNGASGMVRQSSGKLVLAASCVGSSLYNFCLTRFDVDGNLDTSFGNAGKVIAPIGSSQAVVNAVALDSTDRIVVAGRCTLPTAGFCVARFNANGALDTTFGNGGAMGTTIIGSADEAFTIAITSTGKIVLAGSCTPVQDRAICISRYLTDGTLDLTFNPAAPNPADRGKVITNVGDGMAYAVSSLADQRVVVAGYCRSAAMVPVFCALRYNEDGTADNSFGTSGKTLLSLSPFGNRSIAMAATLQPDGKLVVVGYCGISTDDDFCVARLNADGTLDATFNGTGSARTPVGEGRDNATSVALQPDGRIVVAGTCFRTANDADICAARYNANGTPDTSFNRLGKIVIYLSDGYESASAVLVQPDGKIVIGAACNETASNVCVIRYSVPCTLDIDGDGAILATTDALLFARISLGLTGSAVTASVNFPETATRKTWTAIRDHLVTQCGMTLAQ